MNSRDTVLKIIGEELGAEQSAISERSRIVEDLEAGSPHVLEIAMAIEEQFGIKVPDADLARLHTVGDFIEYVRTRTGG